MEPLKKLSEFKLTYSKGKYFQNSLLRLFVYKRKDGQDSKVSFVVSKKFGNAVQRNRLKRLMRESWRTIKYVPGERNFILLPRHKLKEAHFEKIKESLSDLIEKVK